MNTLIQKVAGLLPFLEERDTVYLFAIGMREEIERWEIILSAAWADAEPLLAVQVVAQELAARLETNELVALAGVTIIPSSEPNIRDMPKSLENVAPEELRVINLTMAGLHIQRVFIFKARPSLAKTSGELLAAAG